MHEDDELDPEDDPVLFLRRRMKDASLIFEQNQRDGVITALGALNYFVSKIEGCETVFHGGSHLTALQNQLRFLDDGFTGPIFTPKVKGVISFVAEARAHLAAAFDLRIRMGETRVEAARRVLKDFGKVDLLRGKARKDQSSDADWLRQLRKDAKLGLTDPGAHFMWTWYQSRTRGAPAHEALYEVEYQLSIRFARNQCQLLKKAKETSAD